MIRRLFTAASALSLLLGMASAILWFRSDSHAFGMSDITQWDAAGHRVPVGYDSARRFGASQGPPPEKYVPHTDSHEWKLEWVDGRLVWHSRRLHLNHSLYPDASILRGLDVDGAGLSDMGTPSTPAGAQNQLQAATDLAREIQSTAGWTRGGFAYSSHTLLLQGSEGTDTSGNAIIRMWFPTFSSLLLPAIWAMQWLVARRSPSRVVRGRP